MSEDHVGELHLKIRTDAGQETVVRSAAERFARRVLEACGERLERRAPGRVVLIRRLPIRWALETGELDDPTLVEHCAEDLAAAIETYARSGTVPVADGLEVAVFDDEAHWYTAFWLDQARRQRHWFHSSLESQGPPIAPLGDTNRHPLVLEILSRLSNDGTLVEVLIALPADAILALVQALGLDIRALETLPDRLGMISSSRPEAERRAISPRPSIPRDNPPLARIITFARSLPLSMSHEARAVAITVQARRLLCPSAGADIIASAFFETSRHPIRSDSVQALETPSLNSAITSPPVTASEAEPAEGIESSSCIITTRYGGLFYLLNIMLELDLGEILWKACLPEGAVLAHAMAALLGSDAVKDPAPWLLGGVPPETLMPSVLSEQQEEIGLALLASLTAALPRRGLAALPETSLTLADHPTGRLLVATARDSPFVLFAQPAPTLQAAEAGIRAFLAIWPRSSPPVWASPILAELDASARLRPRTSSEVAIGPFLPAADVLLAQVIGSPCAVFTARTGEDEQGVADFLRRFLKRPARVTSTPETLIVMLPISSIDMALRRVALDRNPGWISWLQQEVRIDFEEEVM